MTTFYIISAAALLAACIALLVLWLRTRIALVLSDAENAGLREKIEVEAARILENARRERAELEKVQESFRLEFRNLAGDILEEKSKQFRETNKESVGMMLNPLKETIDGFKKRVEEIYSDENRQQGALKSELRNLLDLNRRITQETSNLTSSLRGSGKMQGDWGEMILERMLESSNLCRDVHYFVQENVRGDDGANLRPDIILALPEGKRIVIDSKVSLTAYVGLSGAEDETARENFTREHLGSVRRHVAELHAKNYQGVVADSPDFVIMFVPSEPAFMAALQADSALWGEAYNKKVIVSSPTNLFALLKIVDDLWKRDNQSKHALEIARQGGALYDKFVGFVSSLEDVGRNIERAQKSYDQAYNQLKTGRGNLVTSSERLREMGVRASKKLSSALVEPAAETSGHLDTPENPAPQDAAGTE